MPNMILLFILDKKAFVLGIFKAWLIGDPLIVDRDFFFAIEIAIGDPHFV